MKNKTTLNLMLMFALLFFPMVSADIIISKRTNVYFEQNGQPYNGNIEFTVKGYGYSTGMPGDPFFDNNKEPSTYTPEVVYSFSAIYNNYGDKIYENYYRNYIHVDYYELEGKTADGRTFIIKNIESIPTNCKDFNQYVSRDSYNIYYVETNESRECLGEIKNYKPRYGPAMKDPLGTERIDRDGNIWIKREGSYLNGNIDGLWYSDSNPGQGLGDENIDKEYGGLNYSSKGCSKYLKEMTEEEMDLEKDKDGHPIEEVCELRFNLDNATWSESRETQGLWNMVGCFFKKLFGGSC